MRRIKLLHKALAIGVPVTCLAGCDLLTQSENTTPADTNVAWEQSTDLVSEFGGYSFKNEPREAFGDREVLEIARLEEVAAVAEADSVVERNGFAVRILWGQLQGNPKQAEFIEWDGCFSVSSGRLGVRRTIAFERPTDHLVQPRPDRQTVCFESQTRPHFDGLLLVIQDTENDSAATLTMETGPLTASWTFADLRAANLVVPVGDLGNAVSITALVRPVDPACASGAARGHWLQRDGERGVFRGVWVTETGRPVGHIRGHFGLNEAGEHVWFAKIIGPRGRLIGLARGTFVPDPTAEMPGGTFMGAFAVRHGETTGRIEGRYVVGTEGENRAAGFFHARWMTECGGDGAGEALPG